MRKDQWIGTGLILALVVLTGVGLWKTSADRNPGRIPVVRRPRAVMGTTCQLVSVVPPGKQALAERSLREAEAVLRDVEARMSAWLADSEVSGFNAAAADEEVPLSPQTLEVLRAARDAFEQTGGAFDVTCRPLIELWQAAAQCGSMPEPSELANARNASNWDLIELRQTKVVKHLGTVRVDLGGIAKGYAIDRAVEVLQRAGVKGGLVDIGGDVACFGKPPSGDGWIVDVKDPSGKGKLAGLRLAGGAVCTSGGYARYVEVAGRRYSHILDPRTGLPADAVLSVTVVAATAMQADVWATALSVLGPEGLNRLPDGVEAMMLVGTNDSYQGEWTIGFNKFWEEPPREARGPRQPHRARPRGHRE